MVSGPVLSVLVDDSAGKDENINESTTQSFRSDELALLAAFCALFVYLIVFRHSPDHPRGAGYRTALLIGHGDRQSLDSSFLL